jgi:membrane protein DedA with SNARE-associated domain
MEILNFIQIHHLHNYLYVVIFLALAFDAAITVFGAMFLMVQGSVSPLPTMMVLVLGVLAEQLVWYEIGRRLGKSEKLSMWLDKPARPFDKHLIKRPMRTLIFSKFIYGIHRAMLVRAGMLKMNYRQYLAIAALSTVIWLAVLGSLGFGFGLSYEALKKYLNYAELIPLLLVAIYFFVDWRIAQRLKREL